MLSDDLIERTCVHILMARAVSSAWALRRGLSVASSTGVVIPGFGSLKICFKCCFCPFAATSTSIDRSAPIEIGLQSRTQGKVTAFLQHDVEFNIE